MPHNVPTLLRQHIQEKGPMSLADYMSTCLYAPDAGYYMKKMPFGTQGDFTTAPEITQMFGEIIAGWIVDTWIKMGEPANVNIVEMGPGRGTLMHDILRTLPKMMPALLAGARVTLLEISPFLADIQRQTLEGEDVYWASKIEDIDLNHPTILVANEVLDAFPVRQFQKVNDAYIEMLVAESDTGFKLVMGDVPHYFDADMPDVVETSPLMDTFLTYMRENIKQGAALFFDYGARTTGDSIQAVKDHSYVHLFESPGEADITAHVNFAHVQDILGHDACQYDDMGLFLARLGLPARALQLAQAQQHDPEAVKAIEDATYRLLHPDAMGHHFKVLTWQQGVEEKVAGFS